MVHLRAIGYPLNLERTLLAAHAPFESSVAQVEFLPPWQMTLSGPTYDNNKIDRSGG
jgi:hypothetical protein